VCICGFPIGQISSSPVELVSSVWARSPLAPDPRSVRNPRFRVHAPANAGRHGHPVLSQVATRISQFRLTGANFGESGASGVARPWLLRSRAKSPRHSKNGYGSTWRKPPAGDRANATTFRNREIHRARSSQLCLQSIGSDRRSEYCSRFGEAFQFARINRFRPGPANALATCSDASPKIRWRDFQLRTSRSWRAHLRSPEAEMRCVSR
jgi:hypothetical protein